MSIRRSRYGLHGGANTALVVPSPDIDLAMNYIDRTDFLASAHYAIDGVQHGWEGPSGQVNVADIDLDLSAGPPGGSGKSMKYTYRDRTADLTFPTRCDDYSIYRNYRFVNPVKEAWYEVDFWLDPIFTVVAPPAWACNSGAGLKFFFPGLVLSPNVNRFGTYLHETTWGYDWPGHSASPNGTYSGGNSPPSINTGCAQIRGTGWNKLYVHIRCSQVFTPPVNVTASGTFRAGSTALRLELAASTVVAVNQIIVITYASNGQKAQGRISSVSGSGGATPAAIFTSSWTGANIPTASDTYELCTTGWTGDGIVGLQHNGKRGLHTGLVTGTHDTTARRMILTAGQEFDGVSFCRNMNQGPAVAQVLKWGRMQAWLGSNNPGFGF